MPDLKTKKYVFAGLIVLVLGGSVFSYAYWKNKRKGMEIAPKEAGAIVEEEAETEPIQGSEPVMADEKLEAVDYWLHRDITSTFFWVGEKAGDDNDDISNSPSAWDENWKKHYGGVDSPKKRKGFLPSKFYPKENPFYAALPYNDFGKSGKRKEEVFSIVPWVKSRNISDEYSVLKNRWIRIIHNGKIAYAQWEDVGPFEEDDAEYVFGTAAPKNKENKNAGIDVSPAVRDYLGLSDIDKVDWQFVEQDNVPDGVWKKIVTVSQVYWR